MKQASKITRQSPIGTDSWKRIRRERERAFRFLVAIFATTSLLAFVHSRIWAHEVGEPLLEQLPIWSRCCNQHDCIPQPVSILRKEEKTLTVDIAGSQASVDKSKFSPVPSTRTWVCYVTPNEVVSNDNIRCILHPQHSGTI